MSYNISQGEIGDRNISELKFKGENPVLGKFIKETEKVFILKKFIDIKIENKSKSEMTTQAKVEDIFIPIFDGTNFASWKLRLMLLLEYKECKETATRERIDSDTEVAWNKKDLKARMIIMSTVSDRQLEYIGDCSTAYAMMTKLDGIYTSKSTALQIIQRGKIEEIKLTNYAEVDDFFVNFEKSINDFRAAGGEFVEAEKLRYLLRALPSN